MNTKAKKFNDFLKVNQLEGIFQIQEVDNELHSVVYQTFMQIGKENLPALLVIDDSIFVMFQVRVAHGVVKESNRQAIMEHLNALNGNFKSFKYYVDEEQSVIIESCMHSTDNEFVPELLKAVIDVIMKHLEGEDGAEGEYSRIMRTIWSN